MSRILIFGASGQLGSALCEVYRDEVVLAPSSDAFNFAEEGFLGRVRGFVERGRPDLVISTVAFHDVRRCEKSTLLAFDVNACAVGDVSRACAEIGVPFAHVSTDYVFRGRHDPYEVDDGCDPVNAYGVSKHAGERLALIANDRAFIFRTAGLFGPSGKSRKGPHVLERVLRAAQAGEAFRAVGNVYFCPSYAPHVARAMRDVIEDRDYGIHHVAGVGCVSWYEFASYGRDVFYADGSVSKPSRVGDLEQIALAELQEPFRRPMRVDLGSDPSLMPSWRIGVEEYVRARRGRA